MILHGKFKSLHFAVVQYSICVSNMQAQTANGVPDTVLPSNKRYRHLEVVYGEILYLI